MDYSHFKASEKWSLKEGMYNIIKVIDPINKHLIIIKNNKILNTNRPCYECWKKYMPSNDHVLMKIYNEKNTFVRVESCRGKTLLIIAAPLLINDETYILEFLKNIPASDLLSSSINIDTDVNMMSKSIIFDGLTGVYNKIYMDGRLPVDINMSLLSGSPLSVIVTNINCLSNIIDKYGQSFGNKVLTEFAGLIENYINEKSDWVARYDEDKFIIVLDDTSKEDAFSTAEKIRVALLSSPFQYNGNDIKITANFSVYCIKDNTANTGILPEVIRKLRELRNSCSNSPVNSSQIKASTDKLHLLKNKIHELREILNEACITSDGLYDVKQQLEISRQLDELIVEYMKSIE